MKEEKEEHSDESGKNKGKEQKRQETVTERHRKRGGVNRKLLGSNDVELQKE